MRRMAYSASSLKNVITRKNHINIYFGALSLASLQEDM